MNTAIETLPPIYEFLLWNNCNNNCKFCHQKARKARFPGKFLDAKQQAHSIQLVHDFLTTGHLVGQESMPAEKKFNMLLMGGELFDNRLTPANEKAFYDLADVILVQMMEGRIDHLYVNTNLLYDMDIMLLDFLYRFVSEGLSSRIRFTTSCDVAYRFSSYGAQSLMFNNLRKLRITYPEIPMVANCILTDSAVSFLLNNPEYPVKFEDCYGTRLNLIPYIVLKNSMAPERSEVHKVLLLLNELNPGYLKAYVDGIDMPQKKFLYEYDSGSYHAATSADAACGHGVNFGHCYKSTDDKKSGSCFICDCKSLLDSVS